MKKIKIQVLCTIILLGNVVSLYSMLPTLKRLFPGRPITSGMSRETAAMNKLNPQPLNVKSPIIRDTSTVSGWLWSKVDSAKSWFQGSPVQPAISQPVSYAPVGTVSFGSRGFSTTIPQRSSLWQRIFGKPSVEELIQQKASEALQDPAIQGLEGVYNKLTLMTKAGENPWGNKTWQESIAFNLGALNVSSSLFVVMRKLIPSVLSNVKTIDDLILLYTSIDAVLKYYRNKNDIDLDHIITFGRTIMGQMQKIEEKIISKAAQEQVENKLSEEERLACFMVDYFNEENKEKFLAAPGALEQFNRATELGLDKQLNASHVFEGIIRKRSHLFKQMTADLDNRAKESIKQELQNMEKKYGAVRE